MAEWVEEGLIARGDAPPTGPGWGEKDWVGVPPGSHLPFSKSALVDCLLEQLPDPVDAHVVADCFRLIGLVVNARAWPVLERLKDGFAYFDPGAPAPPHAEPENLKNQEIRFFSNLMLTLVRGNFVPLSDEAYRKAIDQRFVLDVPIKVQWERLDGEPIRRFVTYADSEEGAALRRALGLFGSLRAFIAFPEAFEERALVFYRGIAPLRSEGTFVAAKLDVWLTRILRIVAFPVVYFVERLFRDPKRELKEGARLAPPTSSHQPRRWVRRIGLENLPLTALFRRSRLQEPAYREMVVVFRQRSTPPGLLQKVGLKGAPPDAEAARRKLYIKIFRDIPLADSEIVFPENKPQMRTLDAVLLTVTAVAAAPAVIKAFASGGGAALVVAIVLLTYVSKVVGQYMRARQMRMARMAQELYHKTRDNDGGVLQYLVDAGEEQDFKEVALVYGVLLGESDALTADEADARVEAFVHEHFSGMDVDFDIADALTKAVDGEDAMGLLVQVEGKDGQTRYRARPPAEVHAALLEAWRRCAEPTPPPAHIAYIRPSPTPPTAAQLATSRGPG